jgi:uncharacterized Ntn-hydrolase superfamily protein
MMAGPRHSIAVLATVLLCEPVAAQEPAAWRRGEELVFHTFSIAAIDPATRESGVAVTTRNPCVGNGVPWVRAGVGAVATQASTRTEYGDELLDLIASGVSPREALERRLAEDENRERRQIGVIALDGRSAQHGGASNSPYAGQRSGPTYVVQGNTLAGPEVLDAVARTFEASEGSHRHLADRLIEALNAGHALGGDRRHGETQSAAVLVADPRPGISRRADGLTVQINVCEHPDPLTEMRRIYDTISETLGFRVLMKETGNDVFQLKLMLHALGYFRPDLPELTDDLPDRSLYTDEAVDAVDRFRRDQPGWGATVPGYVDAALVGRLWSKLEEAGKANAMRRRLRDILQVRR